VVFFPPNPKAKPQFCKSARTQDGKKRTPRGKPSINKMNRKRIRLFLGKFKTPPPKPLWGEGVIQNRRGEGESIFKTLLSVLKKKDLKCFQKKSGQQPQPTGGQGLFPNKKPPPPFFCGELLGIEGGGNYKFWCRTGKRKCTGFKKRGARWGAKYRG